MNQTERIRTFIREALVELGFPDFDVVKNWDLWDLRKFREAVSDLGDLVTQHGQMEAEEDALPRSQAAQVRDLKKLSMAMSSLRKILENLPEETKWRCLGLGPILEGMPGEQELWLPTMDIKILPKLQQSLGAMSDRLDFEVKRIGVRKGSKKTHPDQVLVAGCLRLAKVHGKSKEAGYRVARAAFWASTGAYPAAEDWRRNQVKGTKA